MPVLRRDQVAVPAGREVVVDLGTGDGRFVLRLARARPDALVIGLDALAEPMEASASRAGRKPARGGAENVLFVACDALDPPDALAGRASLVTVNYPWGSLLRAVGEPDVGALRAVAGLLRPGGRIVALLNASAAEDRGYAERLELPALDPEAVAAGWRGAGLAVEEARLLGAGEEPPHRTSWGQRLVRGSGRATLVVSAVRPSATS